MSDTGLLRSCPTTTATQLLVRLPYWIDPTQLGSTAATQVNQATTACDCAAAALQDSHDGFAFGSATASNTSPTCWLLTFPNSGASRGSARTIAQFVGATAPIPDIDLSSLFSKATGGDFSRDSAASTADECRSDCDSSASMMSPLDNTVCLASQFDVGRGRCYLASAVMASALSFGSSTPAFEMFVWVDGRDAQTRVSESLVTSSANVTSLLPSPTTSSGSPVIVSSSAPPSTTTSPMSKETSGLSTFKTRSTSSVRSSTPPIVTRAAPSDQQRTSNSDGQTSSSSSSSSSSPPLSKLAIAGIVAGACALFLGITVALFFFFVVSRKKSSSSDSCYTVRRAMDGTIAPQKSAVFSLPVIVQQPAIVTEGMQVQQRQQQQQQQQVQQQVQDPSMYTSVVTEELLQHVYNQNHQQPYAGAVAVNDEQMNPTILNPSIQMGHQQMAQHPAQFNAPIFVPAPPPPPPASSTVLVAPAAGEMMATQQQPVPPARGESSSNGASMTMRAMGSGSIAPWPNVNPGVWEQ